MTVPLTQEAKGQNPGAFTREFLMATGTGQQVGTVPAPPPSTLKAPAAFDPAQVPGSEARSERRADSASFTNSFQTGVVEAKEPAIDGPSAANKGATGEFTSFFGGPFQAPAASEVPMALPDPLTSAPSKKEPGDFTRMFGALKPGAEAEQWPSSDALPQPSKPDQIAPALEPSEPGASSEPGVLSFVRKSTNIPPLSAPPELWRGSSSPVPAPPQEKADLFADAATIRRSAPAGATQVFVPGGRGPDMVPPPSGPSEFTRIISRAPSPDPRAEPPAGAPSPDAARFGMPSIPQMPAASQIPGMQAPQIPAMQPLSMPGMPPMSMPKVPQAPAMAAGQGPTAGGKMSYLPLIIIFNVLFIVAVLIVLYFAFKH